MASVEVDYDVEDGTLRRRNGTFLENIPEVEKAVAREFAETLGDAVRTQIDSEFDTFTGDMERSVNVDRKASPSGSKYELTVDARSQNGVNYAAWHEYAEKPHFVPFTDENQPIVRWAKMKGLYRKTYGVTVTPQSFMEPAVSDAIKKARRRFRRGGEVRSALQRVFKG